MFRKKNMQTGAHGHELLCTQLDDINYKTYSWAKNTAATILIIIIITAIFS